MMYSETEILAMFKALSNPTRLQIMEWLKDPDKSFEGCSDSDPGLPGWGGACVGTIQEKAGVSPSLVSSFLKLMLQAGLLEAKRHEKWTYYRINHEAVKALSCFVDAWNH